MSAHHRFTRKFVAVTTGLLLSAATLVGAGAANANATTILIGPQIVGQNGQLIWVLTDAPTGTPMQVLINGSVRVTTPLLLAPTGEDYIRYDRAWGLGTIQLRGAGTQSVVEPLRAAVRMHKWEFKRIGPGAHKLRVKVVAQRFNPGKNKWLKAPRPILQAKMGKWKTVRKIKLNKKGKAQITIRPKKAYKYRFVVNQTKQNLRTIQESFGKI